MLVLVVVYLFGTFNGILLVLMLVLPVGVLIKGVPKPIN